MQPARGQRGRRWFSRDSDGDQIVVGVDQADRGRSPARRGDHDRGAAPDVDRRPEAAGGGDRKSVCDVVVVGVAIAAGGGGAPRVRVLRQALLAPVRVDDTRSNTYRTQAAAVRRLPTSVRRPEQPQQTRPSARRGPGHALPVPALRQGARASAGPRAARQIQTSGRRQCVPLTTLTIQKHGSGPAVVLVEVWSGPLHRRVRNGEQGVLAHPEWLHDSPQLTIL